MQITAITRSLILWCGIPAMTLVHGCIRSGYSGTGHEDAGDFGAADAAITSEASPQQDGGGLAAARLTSRGAVLVWGQHDVASDGTSYAAAWVEHPPGDLSLRLVFATVSPEGALVHGPILVTDLQKELSLVELFYSGDHYVLFYRSDGSSEIIAARIKISSETLAITSGSAGSYGYPHLHARQGGFAVAYTKNVTCPEQTSSEHQVYLRLLDADGLPASDPVRVECTGKRQLYPKATWTGSRHFVIWTDYRSGTRVYYATLDQDLSSLQSPQLLQDLKATQSANGLASGGQGRVLASWTQGGKLWHLAATEEGAPLWSEAKPLIPENRLESLTNATAGGDGRVAVVWESDSDTVLTQIKLAAFDLTLQTTPQALDAVLVSHLDYSFLVPRVARGPGGFGVTFWGQVEGERGLFFEVVPD
jgi:hypothetical protein